MLEIHNLECVRGDHRLFSALNFVVSPGELLHVKGPNGSGKTTLLRTLCGLSQPSQGKVLWRGEAIDALADEYYRELTYIGHLNGVKDELTAVETLYFAAKLSQQEADEDAIYEALRRIGLRGREELPAKVLSQGQKRRVALARLLLNTTRLWVLDEPYTALDVAAIGLLQEVIAGHLNSGGMVVLTTHQDVEIEGVVRQLNLAA
ncbi:MAG: heme ABC transporter ATP-binding protein CcmA [Gammaproteobacteria bacterium RBG_16_57_12]|nr:MAG: heme ABC transporter ATP-binding protein CcmA [Gammaproteobacteria bacterium RBG_16_57_12]